MKLISNDKEYINNSQALLQAAAVLIKLPVFLRFTILCVYHGIKHDLKKSLVYWILTSRCMHIGI